MTEAEALQELENYGTAQNRKVYKRHGIGDNLYGVSMANLKLLARKTKTNHQLAQQLWASENHDARMLATKIADPTLASEDMLELWVQDLDNYVITDAFAKFVTRTPYALAKMEEWSQSGDEWIGRAGWRLLTDLAMKDPDLPDEYFEDYLGTIQQNIHTSPNRVKDAMNWALIAIGIRNHRLEKPALTAAGTIGKVSVDHGQTSCKTPDATRYIRQTLDRRQKRASQEGQ